jgi:hypothetical protein
MTTTMAAPRERTTDVRRASPILTKSLAAGVLAALVVLAFGAWYVLERPVRWEATSSFVVFPQTRDPGTEASYYETLARGQIVSTMAQIVSAQQDDADAEVVVQVVPETSLITLTATASTRVEAEAVASRQLGRALVAVRELELPFEVRPVNTGEGTGVTADASTTTLIGVVVFVALVLGLLVQETLAALGRRHRRVAGLE